MVVSRITTASVMLHESSMSISNGGSGATRTSTDATISTGKINARERSNRAAQTDFGLRSHDRFRL